MRKELQPHGTLAAARRHQRAKDPLCDPCIVALREYRRKYRAGVNGRQADDDQGQGQGEESGEGFKLPSELDETRANYQAVVAAMSSPSTPATALSSLSARREALYTRLATLEEQELHRALVSSISDGELAAEAVRAAGGGPLDALIARSQAGRKPLRDAGPPGDGDD